MDISPIDFKRFRKHGLSVEAIVLLSMIEDGIIDIETQANFMHKSKRQIQRYRRELSSKSYAKFNKYLPQRGYYNHE